MDSLTHIALGAVIGEAIAGKRVGKTALILGAIAQSIPDLDFVAGVWLDADENLLAHRGFTHSILFVTVVSLLSALVIRRWWKNQSMPLTAWVVFFLVEMLTHLFLDTMNVYGVGLLEPFSNQRFSFNVLFVADPLFSIAPGLAALYLIFSRQQTKGRKHAMAVGLLVPAVYLTLAILIKMYVLEDVRMQLRQKNMSDNRYFVTPTMMNVLLWYIVVEDSKGYQIAFRSVFDHGALTWRYHQRNAELLKGIETRADVQRLTRFSKDFYVVNIIGGRLILSDLRFGQVFGWNKPDAPFVFNYDLDITGDNALVIQRGRFSGLTLENLRLTAQRIAGR